MGRGGTVLEGGQLVWEQSRGRAQQAGNTDQTEGLPARLAFMQTLEFLLEWVRLSMSKGTTEERAFPKWQATRFRRLGGRRRPIALRHFAA
jgi:hypothetical protein